MELKDFVKNVIVEISEGIEGAIKDLDSKGVFVNPETKDGMGKQLTGGKVPKKNISVIDFEVYVNTINKEGSHAGIGVLTSFINLGYGEKKDDSVQIGNKISFSIPVVFQGKSFE